MQSKAIWQSHQPILPMGIALVLVTLHAATCVAGILVDFNDATDANDLAIGGVVRNVVPNVPGSIFESDDLAKSQGGSSNIDLRVNGNWQDTFLAGQAGAFAITSPQLAPGADDFLFLAGGTTGTVRFEGLTGSRYKLEIVSSRSTDSSNPIADITVNGLFADTLPNGDDYDAHIEGFDNGNLMIWNNVAPVSGQISVAVSVQSGRTGFLNAVHLIPEPASMMLLVIGGIVILR